jgi:4'-phosphopantetheinyl transferase
VVRVLARAELDSALRELAAGRMIERDASGKPFLPGGPHFNVSHSGELALLAVSDSGPVGVDLEGPRDFSNAGGIARRICSPRELARVTGLDGEALATALLALWVRKEAVAKAHGDGIRTALSGIDVSDDVVSVPLDNSRWQLRDMPSPAPGYVAAVAWAMQADHVRVE